MCVCVCVFIIDSCVSCFKLRRTCRINVGVTPTMTGVPDAIDRDLNGVPDYAGITVLCDPPSQ